MSNNSKEFNEHFSARLRKEMQKNNIRQEDLAKAIGVSRQAISQYTDGSTQPKAEKLYYMAQYLGVSSDYLLGLSDYTAAAKQDIGAITGLSEKNIDLLKMWATNFKNDDYYFKTFNTFLNEILSEYMPDYNYINLLCDCKHNADEVKNVTNDFVFHHSEKQYTAFEIIDIFIKENAICSLLEAIQEESSTIIENTIEYSTEQQHEFFGFCNRLHKLIAKKGVKTQNNDTQEGCFISD